MNINSRETLISRLAMSVVEMEDPKQGSDSKEDIIDVILRSSSLLLLVKPNTLGLFSLLGVGAEAWASCFINSVIPITDTLGLYQRGSLTLSIFWRSFWGSEDLT